MHRILPNLILMLVFVGFFLYSMHKDRSRYRNTVLLLFAGLSLLSLIYSFFSGKVNMMLTLITFVIVGLAFLILPFFLFLMVSS